MSESKGERAGRAQAVAHKARQLMLAIKRDDRGNPITLEGCIRSVLLKSPDFAQYRDDALDTLYCLLGSGIEWCDGRLTDYQPNNYMNLPPDTHYGVWSQDRAMDEGLPDLLSSLPKDQTMSLRDTILERRGTALDRAIDVVDNIEERCMTYRPKELHWYPVSWYGSNLCVPTPAQDDFLDGAIETASLIVAFDPPLDKNFRRALVTRRYARMILPILEARRSR